MKLYIDPGTGSMLFAILIGVFGVLRFACKGVFIKLKFLFSGGKKTDAVDDTIPLAIFADDKRYWKIFEPVICELDRRGFGVTYLTASPDDPALQSNIKSMKCEFIGDGNRAFGKMNFLKATMVLSTTPGLDVYQWKRSKDVQWYVHMMHGMSEIAAYHMFGIDFYDALMLSGAYQERDVRNLERIRGLPKKEIELIGIPYMDCMMTRIREAGPVEPHERTVLLAPSWGKSSVFGHFGGRIIALLLETGYHIIVRPHPQSFTSEKEMIDTLMAEYPESAQLEWNRDTDNFEVQRRSDIMISDFSSIVLEYALGFDKPVICMDTEFDIGPYDAWWLDTPFWTDTALPRIGRILTEENLPKLKALIDESIDDASFTSSRHQVREETWVYPGAGAARAADYLVRKFKALTELDKREEAQSC